MKLKELLNLFLDNYALVVIHNESHTEQFIFYPHQVAMHENSSYDNYNITAIVQYYDRISITIEKGE